MASGAKLLRETSCHPCHSLLQKATRWTRDRGDKQKTKLPTSGLHDVVHLSASDSGLSIDFCHPQWPVNSPCFHNQRFHLENVFTFTSLKPETHGHRPTLFIGPNRRHSSFHQRFTNPLVCEQLNFICNHTQMQVLLNIHTGALRPGQHSMGCKSLFSGLLAEHFSSSDISHCCNLTNKFFGLLANVSVGTTVAVRSKTSNSPRNSTFLAQIHSREPSTVSGKDGRADAHGTYSLFGTVAIGSRNR